MSVDRNRLDDSGFVMALPRSCANSDGSPKRRYASREQAERFARRTTRDHRNDPPAAAYLCPSKVGPAHFHVGGTGNWGDPG